MSETLKSIPAVVVMRPQRSLGRVVKKGHALDGRVVEVTGRGSRLNADAVYVRPLFGDEEFKLSNAEVEEVRK